MQLVTLIYELERAGWASATLVTPTKQIAFVPSYLSDALGDLVRAVISMAKARLSKPAFVLTKCVEWFGEPTGLDLVFETQQDGSVRLQLVEMPDESHRQAGRKVLFDDIIDFDALAMSVYGQAKQILSAHGVERYRQDWKEEFPLQDLRTLELLFLFSPNV